MKQKTKLKLLSDGNRMRLFLLGIVACLLTCTQLYAQTESRRITGKVTTKEGIPIAAASVNVKGSTNVTLTDDKGAFAITAATGQTIVITSVGFVQQEVKVGASSEMNFTLTEDYANLEDIVVVGYGTMKKTDLSSSQLTVTSEDMKRTVNTTLEQALQGRAANVYVSQTSGQPGAAPSVVIRGLSSLTSTTQPLYVIDGVQIKPNTLSDGPFNHPQGFSNILANINPADIETVNILQGPAATAIYGAAGGTGVVMITTKKGKAGETKIGVTSLISIQDKPKKMPVMNLPQYATFRNELAAAGGTGTEAEFGDPSVLSQGTDWQNELYKRTLLQSYGFNMSGGTDKTHFYLSGEYFEQDGVAPGSGFSRYSTRLNLDNQARHWLKVGLNITASQTKEKVNTTNAGLIELALQQNPSVPVKNPDGSWGGPNTTQFQYTNPVMIANIYNDYNKSTAVIGGAYLNIKLAKGLMFYSEINESLQYYNYYSFHPGYTAGGFIVPQSAARSQRSASNNLWWGFNTRLQYDFKIKDQHVITLMAGHEAQAYQGEGLSGGRINFITNNIQELSGGDASTISNVSNNSNKYHGAQRSFFGRVNYVFNDKYILLGTIRADGSSRFGEDKRWGYFPAVAAAWKISQEEFMKGITAISNLKLRVEYGLSGNQNFGGGGIYAVLQTVPTPWGPGLLSQNFNNPDLQWEVAKTANIGFDLHLFKNRVEIIADAYVKNLEKLLTVATDAYTYGGDIAYSPGWILWQTGNVGTMRNKGFGITVNTINIDRKDLTWKTGLNVSVDRHKITKLRSPITPVWSGTNVQVLTQQGSMASLLTGYIAEGLYQDYNDIRTHAIQTSNGVMTVSPSQGSWVGDIKFRDMNKDGKITADDRVVIGNPWPKFTFGFNSSLTYKNFDLNIFITGVVGNDILNYPRYRNEIPGNTGVFGNYYQTTANFARPSSYNINDSLTVTLTNPGYRIPRIFGGSADPNGNNRVSQWFVEDGSYLRLKNLTLGYNVPAKWISKAAMRSLRVSVGVQNLFTITSYKGYDPEVGMVNFGGTIMAGLDPARYPSTRIYTFSLNAEF